MKINLNVKRIKNIANAMEKLTKNNNRFNNVVIETVGDSKVQIAFTDANCLYKYRLPDEESDNLPENYNTIIPDIQETDIKVVVGGAVLLKAVKTVKKLKAKFVTLHSDKEYLYIETDNYKEKIPLEEEEEEEEEVSKTMKEITVNIDYMLNFLTSLKAKSIQLFTRDSTGHNPLFLADDSFTAKATIMPIIKEGLE